MGRRLVWEEIYTGKLFSFFKVDPELHLPPHYFEKLWITIEDFLFY
jgi:hypothetical protein